MVTDSELGRVRRDTYKNGIPNSLLGYVGLILFFAGQLASAIASGLAPQTLLGCLGSFTLVANSIIAPMLLKNSTVEEKLTIQHVVASCLIICGSATAILFNPERSGKNIKHPASHDITFDKLDHYLLSPPFLALLSMYMVGALVIGWCWSKDYGKEYHHCTCS